MPLFGALREDSLEFLLENSQTVSVPASGMFFRENDPASSMFVLEAGRAAVFKSWKGGELLLRHLKQGDCFGEMALMDMSSRSASVSAVEDCTAIELPTHSLIRLHQRDVEQFAIIQMNMGREVCRRLREVDELLFRVKMGDAAVASDSEFLST